MFTYVFQCHLPEKFAVLDITGKSKIARASDNERPAGTFGLR
jgi:hypothetical protein